MSAELATLARAELATLARGLVVGLALAAAVSLATGAAWPLLRRRFASAHPERRAQVAWLAAAAPAWLPATALALCFAPGLLAGAGLVADHCARHPDHAHLCLVHPSGGLTPLLAALLALGAAALATALLRQASALRRALRAVERFAPAGVSPARDVSIVASDAVFSFALGFLRPRVVLSSALARSLPRRELDAVIEHERAHARRREPLLRLVARLLSFAHLPRVRRSILAEQLLASEQACDEAAARRVGDRLAVAEAILRVERLRAGAPVHGVSGLPAFGESAVEARVLQLIGPEPAPPSSRGALAAAPLAALVALLLADPLHHAAEHLLALILGAR